MDKKPAPKRLSKNATRRIGRLPDEKRAVMARVAGQVEAELGDRVKRASPARVALAKLKLARLREGLSLADVSERTGMDRGNVSRLESSVDNVELNTLARLADAIGYDVVVEFRRRSVTR